MQAAIDWLRAELFTMGAVSNTMIWVIVGLFGLAGTIEWYGRRTDSELMETARPIAVVAWVAFGFFWLNLTPYFFFEHRASSRESSVWRAFRPVCTPPNCSTAVGILSSYSHAQSR